MRVVGVDPGINGAIAVWDGKELVIYDIPKIKSRGRGYEVNIPELMKIMARIAAQGPIYAAFIELVGGRPKEGAGSARKGGITWGLIVGSLSMFCSRVFWPTAKDWKQKMGLTKDKNYSRTRAIHLFPEFAEYFTRAKDHDRAEAALMAMFGFRQMQRRRGRKRLSDVGIKV